MEILPLRSIFSKDLLDKNTQPGVFCFFNYFPQIFYPLFVRIELFHFVLNPFFICMRRLWIFSILFFLFPSVLQAETASFLQPKILGIQKSIVCSDKNVDCHSVFLISGKNFLNSNGILGVRVGNEWAQVIRRSNTSLVATASKAVYEKTPIVSVDTRITRPQLFSSDPVLVSLFEESVDVAIDSIGVTSNGTRYLRAGPKYDSPERVYYRDSYWASGLVLMIEPYVILDQI